VQPLVLPERANDVIGIELKIHRPNISGDECDQRVQYAVKRVMHHVPIELPRSTSSW
jgi:hypothetical protein